MKFEKERRTKDSGVLNKYCSTISGIIISLLIVATATMSVLYINEKKSGTHATVSYLLSPIRNFVDDKDVIVNLKPLRDYLANTYESDPGVSIYFEFLNTGSNISISKDAEFFPASLLKVPVAMAIIKKIEQGKWKWDNELVILSSDKDSHFADLYKEKTGSRHTIESLIKEVLVNSDNTAYSVLLRNLERDELDIVYKHLGLDDFFTKKGNISAKRYAVVMRSLYGAAFLSKEDSEKVLLWLTETPFTKYLEQGLPSEVMFAHKIGVSDVEDVSMDAGIVYVPGRPYLLIVMTHRKGEVAKRIMKDVAERAYTYIVSYDGSDSKGILQ